MIFDALFLTANSIFLMQQPGVQNFVDVKIYTFLAQWKFSISAVAGFVDKGFLLATSNQKIKDHVVECQITSLVWPWLSLTEKQRTINHMIIFFFNDSVNKFYQCCQELHERTGKHSLQVFSVWHHHRTIIQENCNKLKLEENQFLYHQSRSSIFQVKFEVIRARYPCPGLLDFLRNLFF